MPVTSMTGYGHAAGASGPWTFEWDVRSVNGRGLECRFRLPPLLEQSESRLKARAQARLSRGNVNANLRLQGAVSSERPSLDLAQLGEFHDALAAFAKTRGLAPPAIADLVGMRGVVEVTETPASDDERQALAAAIEVAFEAALGGLAAMRGAEGAALGAVISGQIGEIEKLVAGCEQLRDGFPALFRARLEKQVAALLEANERLDEARLHQEAVLLASRADIREELDRLKAHAAAARKLIAGEGAAGRKLDFLAQEFMREANTLCSKSPDTRLTEAGLAMKNVIEQFREQVQNVE